MEAEARVEAAATEAVLMEPAADGDLLPAKTEEPPGPGTGEMFVSSSRGFKRWYFDLSSLAIG